MENDREERKRAHPDYGVMLARRMMVAESKPKQQRESHIVRQALAELPLAVKDVHFAGHRLSCLNEAQLWEVLRKSHSFRSIDLSGWTTVSTSALRSLSLSSGRTLESVDLSKSPVTDSALEVFVTRLFALKMMSLASCNSVTNLGLRSLSQSCGSTLTSIDLTDCKSINSEGMAWISGTIGFGGGCTRLQSLSLAGCTGVEDRGLVSLSLGCRRLRYLSLAGCSSVSDHGVNTLIGACSELAVLNLFQCSRLTNAVLIALGANCPNFISLNIGRVGCVKDEGLRELAKGCPSLASLNITGSKQASEAGLCYLAKYCRGLSSLNVTGCTMVTVRGLEAIITGLDHLVVGAKTFFGFVPRHDLAYSRVQAAQKQIERRAAHCIACCWYRHYCRQKDRESALAARRESAALTIQLSFTAYKKRRERDRQKEELHRSAAALTLQRVQRGHRARVTARALRADRAHFAAVGYRTVPLQSLFRGHLVRKYDAKGVVAILEALRADRALELQVAAQVRVAAIIRWWLSKQRCLAWREVKGQRNRDRTLAARRIQHAGKVYIAHQIYIRKQLELKMQAELERRACIRLQSWIRGCLGKWNRVELRKQTQRMVRRQHRSALCIQSAFRGKLGRDVYRVLIREYNLAVRYATLLQAWFRASRVLHWKDIRANKLYLHTLKRQEMEYEDRLVMADLQRQRAIEANRDDGSDDEELTDEARAIDAAWEEVWQENVGRSVWYNRILGETCDLRPFAFEESLVGLSVKVYWPNHEEYFPGKISRFNRTKGKHRIEYEDGDREWLELEVEQERVLMWVNDAWVLYSNYMTPEQMVLKKAARELREKRKKFEHILQREQRWEKIPNERTGQIRWSDPQTGEVFIATEEAESWIVTEDPSTQDLVYYNTVTGAWAYEDPRFVEDPAAVNERHHAKATALGDLRLAAYLATDTVEKVMKLPLDGLLGDISPPPPPEGLALFSSAGTNSSVHAATTTSNDSKGGKASSVYSVPTPTTKSGKLRTLQAKEVRVVVEILRGKTHSLKLGGALALVRKVFSKREVDALNEVATSTLLLSHLFALGEWAEIEWTAISNAKRSHMTGGANLWS